MTAKLLTITAADYHADQITDTPTLSSSIGTGRRPVDPMVRFFRFLRVQDTGCWHLNKSVNRNGYAQLTWRENGKLSNTAHRLAYTALVGPIPDGLVLDHLCRNRRCVNPAHLEVVTQRVNILRGEGQAAANATKTHCPKGHPYTVENTWVSRTGSRTCRACKTEASIARRHPRPLPTHCKAGHLYTPENTYRPTRGYGRKCRRCHAERERERRANRRVA